MIFTTDEPAVYELLVGAKFVISVKYNEALKCPWVIITFDSEDARAQFVEKITQGPADTE